MRLIRIWFEKTGRTKYISHLDLNRCMQRAISRANIPVWFTEGFNSHPYLTFPVPLALGIDGLREPMDMKITDDSLSPEDLVKAFNSVLPNGISCIKAALAQGKAAEIDSADYSVEISSDLVPVEDIASCFDEFFSQEVILVEKKTKKNTAVVDIKKESKLKETQVGDDGVVVTINLPCGTVRNLSPMLLMEAFENYEYLSLLNFSYTREKVYSRNGAEFE